MPHSREPAPHTGERYEQLVAQLERDENLQLRAESDARRAWGVRKDVREIEEQLSTWYGCAAGYSGSEKHFIGLHIEEAYHNDPFAVRQNEPMTVFLERTAHGPRHWGKVEGFCQRFAPMEFCRRWVRDYWVRTVSLVRELEGGEEEIRELAPDSDVEAVTKALYLRLFEGPEPTDGLVLEVTEQVCADRGRLGARRQELREFFEVLAGYFSPFTWPEFLAHRLKDSTATANVHDLLVTWLQLQKALGIDGAPWVKMARKLVPPPVQAAHAGTGYASLFRVGDLIPVLERVGKRRFDPSEYEDGLRKVAKRPDHVPEWSVSGQKSATESAPEAE